MSEQNTSDCNTCAYDGFENEFCRGCDDFLSKYHPDPDIKIDQLKINLEKAIKALEFYANEDTYHYSYDYGCNARQTLKEIRGES